MLGFDLRETTAGQEILAFGIEQGVKQGVEQVTEYLRKRVLTTLNERFDHVPKSVVDEIQTVNQYEVLGKLAENAVTSKNMEQFCQRLAENNPL